MWLKWRFIRSGWGDNWEYVYIPKTHGDTITAMKDNGDPDEVAEFLEEEGFVQFPVFSTDRWTRFEYELILSPPVNVLSNKIELLELRIKRYKEEIDEHKALLKEIKSKGE